MPQRASYSRVKYLLLRRSSSYFRTLVGRQGKTLRARAQVAPGALRKLIQLNDNENVRQAHTVDRAPPRLQTGNFVMPERACTLRRRENAPTRARRNNYYKRRVDRDCAEDLVRRSVYCTCFNGVVLRRGGIPVHGGISS